MQKAAIIQTLTLGLGITIALHVHASLPTATDKVKQSPLDLLASEIHGAVVYSRHRYVYKVVIGDWNPIELGEGEYARWSPDGKKIGVYDRRKIFVMNADGSNRKLVTDEGWSKHGCPIEFHTNGREIIFIRRNRRGLWAVDISNGKIRRLADLHDYDGEPGISADGTRIACRVGSTAYAIDLAEKTDFRYVKALRACSSGISPDGKWLINNRMGNIAMDIRSWDGKKLKVLRATICQPDEEWDNHHWSNHNDYICTQGGKRGDSYVIKVSAGRCTRVTWVGRAVYPDLYVESAKRITQDLGKTQNSTQETQDRKKSLPVSGTTPVAAVTEDSPSLPVTLVSKNYSRLTSRVLVRCVSLTTRANLDYAAYDSNVMRYDPTMYEPNPPAAQSLSNLHFDKTLVPSSLTDRLSATPLTLAETSAPMVWLPVTEYLMDWNFDLGYVLAQAGWKVSEHTWDDDKLPRPYQEISRVYVHTDKDGTHSLWVRVEFKPWVKFLEDVDDEDSDGFLEIYGMIDSRFFNEEIIQRLLSDYTQRVLPIDEVMDWAHTLATDWYDDYYTISLEPKQTEVWPNAETEPQVKAELDGLVLKQPDVVICGKPFGKPIYNVFLTRRCDE